MSYLRNTLLSLILVLGALLLIACTTIEEIQLFTIEYDSNGGSTLESNEYQKDAVIHGLPTPDKDNLYFEGWFTDSDLTLPIELPIVITENIKLYAKWTNEPYTYNVTEDGIIITKVTSNPEIDTLVIPDQIEDQEVISIAANAFLYQAHIKNLTLPLTITSLPDGVFKGLDELESLSIPFVGRSRTPNFPTAPDALGYMFHQSEPSNTFNFDVIQSYIPGTLHTLELTDATTIPYLSLSITPIKDLILNEGLLKIEALAFYGSDLIQDLIIPTSVQIIEDRALSGMKRLGRIFVIYGNMHFKSNGLALYNYEETRLIKLVQRQIIPYISLPNTLTEIAEDAFFDSKIINVFIPNSVKIIGYGAFSNTLYLNQVTFEANSQIEIIDGDVFKNSGITSIEIPDSVKTIESDAFQQATRLHSVIFTPNSSLESIKSNAFEETKALESIIIPDTVTFMGFSIFSYGAMDTVYAEAPEKPAGWDSDWFNGNVIWNYQAE